MTQDLTGRQRWLVAGAVVLGLLAVGMAVVVLLVLTGIIAEPETVIEAFVRALLGE